MIPQIPTEADKSALFAMTSGNGSVILDCICDFFTWFSRSGMETMFNHSETIGESKMKTPNKIRDIKALASKEYTKLFSDEPEQFSFGFTLSDSDLTVERIMDQFLPGSFDYAVMNWG